MTQLDEKTTAAARSDFGSERLASCFRRVSLERSGSAHDLPTGWITDHTGYRYDPIDPRTGAPWPAMPPVFRDLARSAAEQGGFNDFAPDAGLVNRHEPGTRLSLHQDKDELDYSAPIVSVSLGLPATFLFGGMARADKPRRYRLVHGDVVVWGGPSRLYNHGVLALKEGDHPRLGRTRVNLTLRRAW